LPRRTLEPEVRAAVVGHVEWVEFARVDHVPAPGEIVHVSEVFDEPAGGGAVSAVQLAKLAGNCVFFTALGDDELGHRSAELLSGMGVQVEAVFRPPPSRRGFVHLDRNGERTITVIGERMVPFASDSLPWGELADVEALYFTGGDPGALRAARAARVVVATARGIDALSAAGVEIDALVRSGKDVGETYEPGQIEPPPRLEVATSGSSGGTYKAVEGGTGTWKAAALPGPVGDAYGAGDSFAAGLTFGLGSGLDVDAALELAARCGAAAMTGRGAYEGQLVLAER
jgi:ribokinase